MTGSFPPGADIFSLLRIRVSLTCKLDIISGCSSLVSWLLVNTICCQLRDGLALCNNIFSLSEDWRQLKLLAQMAPTVLTLARWSSKNWGGPEDQRWERSREYEKKRLASLLPSLSVRVEGQHVEGFIKYRQLQLLNSAAKDLHNYSIGPKASKYNFLLVITGLVRPWLHDYCQRNTLYYRLR